MKTFIIRLVNQNLFWLLYDLLNLVPFHWSVNLLWIKKLILFYTRLDLRSWRNHRTLKLRLILNCYNTRDITSLLGSFKFIQDSQLISSLAHNRRSLPIWASLRQNFMFQVFLLFAVSSFFASGYFALSQNFRAFPSFLLFQVNKTVFMECWLVAENLVSLGLAPLQFSRGFFQLLFGDKHSALLASILRARRETTLLFLLASAQVVKFLR